MQRVVQHSSQLLRAPLRAGQVGPPDVPDEERVARQHGLRLPRFLAVEDENGDGFGGVAGSFEETQRHLADRDLIALARRHVVEAGLRPGAEVDFRSRAPGELAVARDEVGV